MSAPSSAVRASPSLPEQLQTLIDALAAYCVALQIDISVPKQMIVSIVPAPAVTCNGNPVEQVVTFQVLGTSFPSVRL